MTGGPVPASSEAAPSPIASSAAAGPSGDSAGHVAFDAAAWMVLTATIMLSFKGIVTKYAYAAGLGVGMVLLLRFAISVPLFWIGERWMNRGKPMVGLTFRDMRDCAATGLLFFMATFSDFQALSYIDAGLSRVILFTFPAVIMVYKSIERRAWPGPRQLTAFVVTWCGLVLLVGPGTDVFANLPWQGLAFALTSAVTYGLFLVRTQTLTTRIGSSRFTVISNTFVLIYMIPAVILLDDGWDLPLDGFVWGAINATLCTVVPFFLLFEGIRRWGAERAGLLTLCGPAFTVAMAILLLDERLVPIQVAGFLVVMVGVSVLQGTDRALLRLFGMRKVDAAG